MNFRTTLVLLILVIAALLVVLRIQSKSGETTTPTENTPASDARGTPLFTVTTFATQAINSITIQQGAQKQVIVRDKTAWRQTEPVAFPMDQYAIDDLNRSAGELRYLEKVKPGEKGAPTLKELELEQPAAVLTFASDENKASNHTIKLGRTTIGGRAYVMVDSDENIYVVGDALHKKTLDAKPGEMRQKSLPSTSEGEAQRVLVTREGKTLELVKSDGVWSLAAPLGGRGDSEAVRSLLLSVTSTRITTFAADKPSDLSLYGLDKPTAVLAIDALVTDPPPLTPSTQPAAPPTPRKVTRTLRIGAPTDLNRNEFFATWSDDKLAGDVVFTIGKATYEALTKNADSFRDARISTIKQVDARELTVARAAEPYYAVKGVNGWAFEPYGAAKSKPAFTADDAAMGRVIETILQARAGAYKADFKPAGEPEITLTLASIGRPEPEVLKLYVGGKPTAKDKLAPWVILRNNETTGYIVSADQLTAVTDPLLSLRDRRVWDQPADKLAKVVLIQSDGATLAFSREIPPAPAVPPASTQPAAGPQPSPWKLLGAAKFELSSWVGAAQQLGPLMAEKWTHEPPKPAGSAITLALEFVGAPPRKLLIDAQTRIASLEGVDSPFIVSQSLVDGLAQELRDRMALSLPTSQLKTIEVRNSDKTITATKDDSGQYVTPDGDKLNQQNAAGIFDLLGGLRVSRYLPKPETLGDDAIVITAIAANKDSATIRVSPVLPFAHVASVISGKPSESWVKLDDATLKKLRADLMAKETPKPPSRGPMDFGGMPGGMPGGFPPDGME